MTPNDKFPRTLAPTELLALAGTDASPEGMFTRRFPGLPKQGENNPRLEEGLIKLGEQLKDEEDKLPPGPPVIPPPPAGYTYLGQFIDHDITFDLTPLKGTQPDETKIPNFRAPFLDLDQVYGGGPNVAPFLYQNNSAFREAERFLIGRTNPPVNSTSATSPNDLPRNPEGIALTGDPRQDENLILGQLHLLFLKLHNWLVEKPKARGNWSFYYDNAGSDFATAQRITRWHYQWIVVHDFLEKILDPAVHATVLKAENEPPSPQSPNQFQIPIEFSVAAFRFGHSMVRNKYTINQLHSDIDLIKLLRLTAGEGLVGAETPPRLPEEWKVDWSLFFKTDAPGAVQPSAAINCRISSVFYDVPERLQRLFSAPVPLPDEEFRLPIRTLLRGARIALPSGQKVAEELKCDVLRGDRVVQGASPAEAEVLRTYEFLEDTPLWYYLLKEAEVLGTNWRLGPAGSKLIADVFIQAMRSTPDSYWIAGGKWEPTLPVRPEPGKDQRSFDMTDLIGIVSAVDTLNARAGRLP